MLRMDGGDQGECKPAKHVPGAEPGKRDTGAGAHTAGRKAKEEGDCSPRSPTISARTCSRGRLRGLRRRTPHSGVDGLTWRTPTKQTLTRNLTDLHSRVHRGAYRALPSPPTVHTQGGWPTAGRSRLPPSKTRSSKRAAVAVLNCNLRGGFPRCFSYGFRPKPGASTMRWMPFLSGSTAEKVTIFSTRTSGASSTLVSQSWGSTLPGAPDCLNLRIIRLIQKWSQGWACWKTEL